MKSDLPGHKICSCCGKDLPFDNFYKNTTTKDGLRSRCKLCLYLIKIKGKDFSKTEKEAYKARKKIRAQEKRRRAEYLTYEKMRDGMLKTKYNMTLADFELLLDLQDRKCGTCNKANDLCVDHCHNTGKVRGILCQGCNKSLGLIKESIDTLKNLINYLERHNAK
jgi:hypothetical protein